MSSTDPINFYRRFVEPITFEAYSKENTILFNLDSTKAAEEGNDGDNCSNDDDDVDGRGVEADVKLALKLGHHLFCLLETEHSML